MLRGLAQVSNWVRLKYVAMNLKKLALWGHVSPCFFVFGVFFFVPKSKGGFTCVNATFYRQSEVLHFVQCLLFLSKNKTLDKLKLLD